MAVLHGVAKYLEFNSPELGLLFQFNAELEQRVDGPCASFRLLGVDGLLVTNEAEEEVSGVTLPLSDNEVIALALNDFSLIEWKSE